MALGSSADDICSMDNQEDTSANKLNRPAHDYDAHASMRPRDRLIAIKEVMARTSLSRSYIYTLVKRQEMPAPIKLGFKCSRWSEQMIERWIAEQIG